jgi:2-polyprenyl-3-methyl-5-hydroxy-6-metoxy-1,4-benzoquinol methylase
MIHNFGESFESNKEVFNFIYKNQLWQNDSGTGSDPKNAKEWIDVVNSIINEKNIKSILDIGCGDWRIGKELNLDNINYLGLDASSDIINKIKHNKKSNIKFINYDAELYKFHNVDLILIKDVLQHLSSDSVKNILSKVFEYAKYALICNDFNKDNENLNNCKISSGGLTCLDLNKTPFNYNLKNIKDFNSETTFKRIYLFEKKYI